MCFLDKSGIQNNATPYSRVNVQPREVNIVTRNLDAIVKQFQTVIVMVRNLKMSSMLLKVVLNFFEPSFLLYYQLYFNRQTFETAIKQQELEVDIELKHSRIGKKKKKQIFLEK